MDGGLKMKAKAKGQHPQKTKDERPKTNDKDQKKTG
jgi:hypothetical protein